MTINKQPIYPHLVRRIPEQFSWIDHRLVRERYIDNLSRAGAALYLFLVTVGDSRGLSYYGDKSICSRLGLTAQELAAGRENLIARRLIGWRHPLYQVLALDVRREDRAVRVDSGPCSLGAILQQAMGGGR
jgi:hypothetical protein